MSDERLRALIYARWDGPLAPEAQAELDAALAADPGLRAELERADRLRAGLRGLGPSGAPMPAPPAFDVDAMPPPRGEPDRVDRPRMITSWGLGLALAAAAVLAALGWWVASTPDAAPPSPAIAVEPAPAPPETAPPAAPEDTVVGFRLAAPDARAVAVAGDFNDWRPETLPMTAGPDGTWSATAALPPGRYAYMYVVDGRWTTPPDAPRTQDDGFGALNGVLDVLAPPDV